MSVLRRILIDAERPEETRVVICDEKGKIQDFDYETTVKEQIKGNIYLAKVTRVEPSLQAAFLEYGAERQGFLPFAEVHPDYYQIPVSDRQKLIDLACEEADQAEKLRQKKEEERHLEDPSDQDIDEEELPLDEESEDLEESEQVLSNVEVKEEPSQLDEEKRPAPRRRRRSSSSSKPRNKPKGTLSADEGIPTPAVLHDDTKPTESSSENVEEIAEGEEKRYGPFQKRRTRRRFRRSNHGKVHDNYCTNNTDVLEQEMKTESDDDSMKKHVSYEAMCRRYKIQEVLKRGQIILVQVIKEERGNKGASFTSYISLAGRYCVLMPNSPGQGGVSRRITDYDTRRRAKDIVNSLNIPRGTSVILRTAGADRNKAEVKKDYSYLVKLWDDIREKTLSSTAPSFIHEESNLIKRTIRDLYIKEIKEIYIEGEEAYKSAKDLVKLLVPSRGSQVKRYKEVPHLFAKYGIEQQIAALYDATVSLPSGGYVVINPTEALVAIDVNSGKSTGERNIEETALKTNLEAAVEIARQLRLRDLSGLIVVDFIDMLEYRNRRAVERALRDALEVDRAKIQLGRISLFGLLEMSRQRLRSSFIEVNTEACKFCHGRGVVRARGATAIMILRAIENEFKEGSSKKSLHVYASTDVVTYLLNSKREEVALLEEKYNGKILITADSDSELDTFDLHVESEEPIKALNKPEPSQSSDDKDTETSSRRRSRSPRRHRERRSETSEVQQKQKSDESLAPKDVSKAVVKESSVCVDVEKPPSKVEDIQKNTQAAESLLKGLWKRIEKHIID